MKNSGLQALGKHLGEFPEQPPAPPSRRDPFLPSPPRSRAEAEVMRRQIAQALETIEGQLYDRSRQAEMSASAYLDWRGRANKARFVKRMQLHEVEAWLAAHAPAPEAEAAELVRDLRDAVARFDESGVHLAPEDRDLLDRATAYLERLAE